jgi:hypothetical protein
MEQSIKKDRPKFQEATNELKQSGANQNDFYNWLLQNNMKTE